MIDGDWGLGIGGIKKYIIIKLKKLCLNLN